MITIIIIIQDFYSAMESENTEVLDVILGPLFNIEVVLLPAGR